MKLRGWTRWLLSLISSLLLIASLGVLSTHLADQGELHISALLLSIFLAWPLLWGLMMFFVDWPDNPTLPAQCTAVVCVLSILVLLFIAPAPLAS
ncbi:MAG: hypothetical protein AAF662_05635 [Pseudomonadota bacterium]